ncbi:UNVERIFIED_CONTAM: hypothetical protein ITH36_25405, partial [Salmonella enterica subsp. enterica serovar Weltevreden]
MYTIESESSFLEKKAKVFDHFNITEDNDHSNAYCIHCGKEYAYDHVRIETYFVKHHVNRCACIRYGRMF